MLIRNINWDQLLEIYPLITPYSGERDRQVIQNYIYEVLMFFNGNPEPEKFLIEVLLKGSAYPGTKGVTSFLIG